MNMYDQRCNRRDAGFVLVAALWLIAVASLLVLSLTTSVRTGLTITRTSNTLAQAQAIADAAVELAATRLQPTLSSPWQADGRPYAMTFAGARSTIWIEDANGRLDINTAPAEQLLQVLQRATGSPTLGTALQQFILKKRRLAKAGNARGSGGTADAGGSSDDPHARRVIFHDLSELLAVSGMTPAMLTRLAGILTVYGAGKGINIMTAPERLLRLLPGVSGQEVDRLLVDRRTASIQGDSPDFAAPSGNFTTEAGPAFTISVRIEHKALPEPIEMSTTILIDTARSEPFYVLSSTPVGF